MRSSLSRRRSRRRRQLWYGGAVLVALLLAGGARIGWQAWHIYRDLSAASGDAAVLQGAVSSGNDAESRAALDQMQARLDDASGRSDGPAWSVLCHAPFIGDDARGVRVVSDALAQLTHDGVRPVVTSSADLDQLAPHNGSIPVAQVQRLQGPVTAADRAFDVADDRIGSQDSSGYVGQWQLKYRKLARQVSDARHALDAAHKAIEVMPSMLGADGPRRYLLVFQNNAEIRATGGLPGAVAEVDVDDGHIQLTQQTSGASFGETKKPVLPLTPAEQTLYGDQLGRYFLDANFTPDFPRAADLWRARWEQDQPPIDGVFAVDPVALSYALRGTGPVQAAGRTLTADNVVPTLLNQVYLDTPDATQQDATFQAVAAAVFNQVTAGTGSSRELLSALARSADEHRLLVHSFHPDEQRVIQGSEVSGALVTTPTTDPQVGLYLNDNTGSKMSYYLRTAVDVENLKCSGGVQSLTGSATLGSVAPADASQLPVLVTGGGFYGVPIGTQLIATRIYGPVGGTVSGVKLDNRPVPDVTVVQLDGRPVATVYVDLKPDQSVAVAWQMTTGANQTGDVQVGVTPGIQATALSSVVPSTC